MFGLMLRSTHRYFMEQAQAGWLQAILGWRDTALALARTERERDTLAKALIRWEKNKSLENTAALATLAKSYREGKPYVDDGPDPNQDLIDKMNAKTAEVLAMVGQS